jgi:hypothetical protein
LVVKLALLLLRGSIDVAYRSKLWSMSRLQLQLQAAVVMLPDHQLVLRSNMRIQLYI